MTDEKIYDYAKTMNISFEEAKKQIKRAEELRKKDNRFLAPACVKFIKKETED